MEQEATAPHVGKFPFNSQQIAALTDITQWYETARASKRQYAMEAADWSYRNKPQPRVLKLLLYVLQGYAGTGKTTLVKELLSLLKIPVSRIALVAPTNRAAKVLANKTGLYTRTLFSLIYMSQREELEFQRQKLRAWDEATNFSQLGDLLIRQLDMDPEEEFQREWEEAGNDIDYQNDDPSIRNEAYDKARDKFLEQRRLTILQYEDIVLPEDPAERLALFEKMKKERVKSHKDQIREILAEDMPVRKKEPSEIQSKYDAILVDESSMVNETQGWDLMSYGVPVIMVGDPFQLPPVKAKAFWDGMRPQSVLTKIERQKGAGAGIPLAGEKIRNGGTPERNESVGIHHRNTLPDEAFLNADQILVGTHKTRERICNFVRRNLGYETAYPLEGEKVVAVYNDKEKGIMNGELYTVMKSEVIRGGSVTKMTIKDPYGKIIENVQAWTSGFPGRSKTDFLDDEFGKFWFGYAITCHQSQGSEWKNVVVCDDWPKGDKEVYARWLYTALTRAATRVEWIKG